MSAYLSIFLIFFLSSNCDRGFVSAENNGKEYRTKQVIEGKVIQLGHPMRMIQLSQVTQLSWRPRVFLYKNFLSEEEADHLVSLVHGERSNGLGRIVQGKLPGNLVIPLDKEDEVVTRIEERISAWTFIPEENGMPLQVLHFRDEESQQTYNYLGNNSVTAEPLMATVVLYLSNVTQGGEILFPESENKVWSDCTKSSNALRPAKGNAIVFFNVHLNGAPDKRSRHARCPILVGDMWCATKLFHLQATRPEKTELQSEDTDCTDEEENCPRWAAVGECQRNPVFMIGSDDYHGTCRKSCRSC